MSTKRILGAIVGFSFLVALVTVAIPYVRDERLRAQEQLLAFRESLTLGLSESEVQKLFASGHYDRLSLTPLSQFGIDNEWIVDTPSQFGAQNWNLHLFFSDHSLSRISVRTDDIPVARALGAPPDIEAK